MVPNDQEGLKRGENWFLLRGLSGWTLTFLGVFLDFIGESAAECEYAANFTDDSFVWYGVSVCLCTR